MASNAAAKREVEGRGKNEVNLLAVEVGVVLVGDGTAGGLDLLRL